MKGISLTLDGIKYFVTCESNKEILLYLGEFKGAPIYREEFYHSANYFNKTKARSFIKRALAIK